MVALRNHITGSLCEGANQLSPREDPFTPPWSYKHQSVRPSRPWIISLKRQTLDLPMALLHLKIDHCSVTFYPVLHYRLVADPNKTEFNDALFIDLHNRLEQVVIATLMLIENTMTYARLATLASVKDENKNLLPLIACASRLHLDLTFEIHSLARLDVGQIVHAREMQEQRVRRARLVEIARRDQEIYKLYCAFMEPDDAMRLMESRVAGRPMDKSSAKQACEKEEESKEHKTVSEPLSDKDDF